MQFKRDFFFFRIFCSIHRQIWLAQEIDTEKGGTHKYNNELKILLKLNDDFMNWADIFWSQID